MPPKLKPDPNYLTAFTTIMMRINHALGHKLSAPVVVCVAGGAAMHFYTGARYSEDIDATLSVRALLDPNDLQIAWQDQEGNARLLYFDTQYNDTFALLHQNAYDDALPIALKGIKPSRLIVKLLNPLDLAVSKLARYSEQDQEDIRYLGQLRLISAVELRQRAEAALPDYVGDLARVKTSIQLACKLIKAAQRY